MVVIKSFNLTVTGNMTFWCPSQTKVKVTNSQLVVEGYSDNLCLITKFYGLFCL